MTNTDTYKYPVPILFVPSVLQIGGRELQMKMLIEGLDKTKFKPIICSITMGGPLEEDFKQMGVPVYVLGKKHKLDISILRRLEKIIFMHKPLIIHSFLFTGNFWGRWAAHRTNTPIVITHEGSSDTSKTVLHWWVDHFLYRYTTTIIANAEAVKSFYAQKANINPDMIQVISNGVEMKRFNDKLDASETLRAQLREKYGIPVKSFVIGNVCRITPLKNLEALVQVAALVRKEISELRIVIVGDAILSDEIPYREKILKLIKESNLPNNFVFTGTSNDVPRMLNIFDLFVQSSLTEGFPNAVMEAMAMAKPVVATSVGGTSELVLHQETGFLVPSNNPQKMAEQILQLYRDPELRYKMGQAGRKRIIENYSAEQLVQKTQELYLNLLHQKGIIPNP